MLIWIKIMNIRDFSKYFFIIHFSKNKGFENTKIVKLLIINDLTIQNKK